MTIRRVWLGSTGPFLFDDAVLYNDIDGVISPDNQQAIATDGQILVQTAPYSDYHVVRKVELDNLAVILSLGTMAYQNANAVAITGGNANGMTQVQAGLIASGFVDVFYNPFANPGIRVIPGADDGTAIAFHNAALSVVGSIAATATATYYNTSSDARLKHAITAITGALDVVSALRPIAYLWKADDSPGAGFLAHEVQQVVDGVVTGEPNAVDDEGQIISQQMDYNKLVPWLTAAIQELIQQVTSLTARVAELEAV